jgi:hypothetical protein
MTDHFAVYEHIRTDTGAVFYVGKGTPSRVRHLDRSYNKHHAHIRAKLQKMGLEIEVRILWANLPNESSIALEKMRIAYLRAIGVDLVNLTEGGDGLSNPSQETRAKLAAGKIGNKHGAGYTHTAENKELFRQQKMGNTYGEANKGRTYSVETIAKQKETKSTIEYKAKASAIMLEAQNRPEVRAKKSAAAKVTHNLPEVKAKKSASSKIAQNDPAVAAAKRAGMLAYWAKRKAEKAA